MLVELYTTINCTWGL